MSPDPQGSGETLGSKVPRDRLDSPDHEGKGVRRVTWEWLGKTEFLVPKVHREYKGKQAYLGCTAYLGQEGNLVLLAHLAHLEHQGPQAYLPLDLEQLLRANYAFILSGDALTANEKKKECVLVLNYSMWINEEFDFG